MHNRLDSKPKPPYPLKPATKPKGGPAKAMTAIAGFRCKDGIVLCADSELTHPDGVKTQVEKIRAYGNKQSGVCGAIAWAGIEDYARIILDNVSDQWQAIESGELHLSSVLHEVAEAVQKSYVNPNQDEGFRLIACEWRRGTGKTLRLFREPAPVPGVVGSTFLSEGTGSPLVKTAA